MENLRELFPPAEEKVTGEAKVIYVALSLCWYAKQGKHREAKELVRVLVRNQLDGSDLEVTSREKELLEKSNPSEVLTC